ncbi:Conserved_hypothetical protein [Hexamita inflata]|uniref:Uncharacterized protein n=1 Tax=Hexamita inflata TaxID=28002 RepID=A0AA86V123_9EUKA|nr:Conserved hypothetical protein [Hexamita inflata]
MTLVASTNILRLSEFKKQWNIRGVDIIFTDQNTINVSIIKEDTKTNFNMQDIFDIQLQTIDQCPQFKDKDINFQYFIILKTASKDIIFGSLSLTDDMNFIACLYLSFLFILAQKNQFYMKQICKLAQIDEVPLFNLANIQSQIVLIQKCAETLVKQYSYTQEPSSGKFTFTLQKVFYSVLIFLGVLSIQCVLQQPGLKPYDIMISEQFISPFALFQEKIYVNPNLIMSTMSSSFENRGDVSPNHQIIQCSLYDRIATFQQYLFLNYQNKALLTNIHLILPTFLSSVGPFVQATYKSMLCFRASTLISEQLQGAYDRTWQKITGSPTAQVSIKLVNVPSFILMPLNSQHFPKLENAKPTYNGMVRMVENAGLGYPLEITCVNEYSADLQEIDGQLVNGSLCGFCLLAFGVIIRQRFTKDVFKFFQLEITENPEKTGIQMLVAHSKDCDQIMDTYKVYLDFKIDIQTKKSIIKIHYEVIERNQFLPEQKRISLDYVYTPKQLKRESEDTFKGLSASANSLAGTKRLQKQMQRVCLNRSSYSAETQVMEEQIFTMTKNQIHINEIREIFYETQSWEVFMANHFLQQFSSQIRDYMNHQVLKELQNVGLQNKIKEIKEMKRQDDIVQEVSRKTSSLSIWRKSESRIQDQFVKSQDSLLKTIKMNLKQKQVLINLETIPSKFRLEVLINHTNEILQLVDQIPGYEQYVIQSSSMILAEKKDKTIFLNVICYDKDEQPERIPTNVSSQTAEKVVGAQLHNEYLVLMGLRALESTKSVWVDNADFVLNSISCLD